jgi:hypothetical protein
MRSLRSTGLAAALLVLAPATFACAGSQVGMSAAVRGDVTVTTDAKARAARSGETMFLGDRVATRAQSGLQILLLDETTFTVGADCQLVIDSFVYDPAKGGGAVSATVSKGALRYVSGLVAKDNPDAVKLKTPSSTIGLRGTTAEVVVGADAIKLAKLLGYDVTGADPRTASIVVLRGPGAERTTTDRRGHVTVTNGGGTVTLDRAGFASFVPSQSSGPLPPVRLTDEAERTLQAMLTQRSVAQTGGGGSINVGSAATGSGQSWVEGRPYDGPHLGFDNLTDPTGPIGGTIGGCPTGTSLSGGGCSTPYKPGNYSSFFTGP